MTTITEPEVDWTTAATTTPNPHRPKERTDSVLWAWTALRLLLGFTFLWAFLDKLFGLGFATCRAPDSSSIDFACDAAMVQGGSPTYGYLSFATANSHTGDLFSWMASSGPGSIGFADIGFMAALFLGGMALILGIGVRTAAIGCAVLVFMMYLASGVWPQNNPFVDSHIIEAVAFLGIATVGAGRFSLRDWAARNVPVLGRIP